VRLMLGGLHHGNRTLVLHSRVRYFDPAKRRAGLPSDVAALVENLEADGTTLTLVNLNQLERRDVVIQAGGYGEHEFKNWHAEGGNDVIAGFKVNRRHLVVRLEPGAGARIVLGMRRYVIRPKLDLPW